MMENYEGRLKSSWTHLITPRRNFVEGRWRYLFRSISLGKRYTSYNAPPTSRKRAANRWSLRNFLPLISLSWLEKPRNRMGRDLDCMSDVLMGFHRSTFSSRTQNSIQITPHAISGLFQRRKRSSKARNFEVINGLQHVFEKWGERCKKCVAYQGRYFLKRPLPHLHKVPTRSNKVSPRTFQMALVLPCLFISHDSGCIHFFLPPHGLHVHPIIIVFSPLPLQHYASCTELTSRSS
jgi:hypothetical protein